MSKGAATCWCPIRGRRQRATRTTLLSTPGNNPSGAGRARDQYNRHLDKAVSSTWQPHVLSTAFDYQLPLGPGRNFCRVGGALARAVGGWHLSGILTYRKRQPGQRARAPQNLPLFAGPNYASTVARRRAEDHDWTGNFDPANRSLPECRGISRCRRRGPSGPGGQYLPNVFGFFYYERKPEPGEEHAHQGAPRPRPAAGDVQHVQSRRFRQRRNGYFRTRSAFEGHQYGQLA